MFWEPIPIAPNDQRVIRTMYGLGGISLEPGELSLGLTAPKQIASHDTITHLLMAYIVNTGGFDSKDTRVSLTLPAELETKDPLYYEIGTLKPGKTLQLPIAVTVKKEGEKNVQLKLSVESSTLPSNQVKRSLTLLPRPELKFVSSHQWLNPNTLSFTLEMENNFMAALNHLNIELNSTPTIRLPHYEDRSKTIRHLGSQSKKIIRWIIPWKQDNPTLNIHVVCKSDEFIQGNIQYSVPQHKGVNSPFSLTTHRHNFDTIQTVSVKLETQKTEIFKHDQLSLIYDPSTLKLNRISKYPAVHTQSSTIYQPTKNTITLTDITITPNTEESLLKYHFIQLKKSPSIIDFKLNNSLLQSIKIKEI